jgi:hypothetical protein
MAAKKPHVEMPGPGKDGPVVVDVQVTPPSVER